MLSRELRAAIRAEFSDLTPRDLDAARAIGRGESATAVRVGGYVVRLPHGSGSASALSAEARLLAGLAARGVPFLPAEPRPLLDVTGAALGMASRYAEGTPAAGPLRPAARERLARDLGAFLSALHAVPPSTARRLGVSSRDIWPARYMPLIEECRPHLDAPLRRDLDRLSAQFESIRGSAPRVLIHGDISAEHVLTDAEGHITAVIDFGDAALGDPALDFAGILNDRSRQFLARVLTHYTGEVTSLTMRRTAFFIAVAPLYAIRAAARRDEDVQVDAAIRTLRARVRSAVVRGRAGP